MEKRNYEGIEYELTRKAVKNINLRITNGTVKVSAHPRVALSLIEQLIDKHKTTIQEALAVKPMAKEYTLYGKPVPGNWSAKHPKAWDVYLAQVALKELRQMNREVHNLFIKAGYDVPKASLYLRRAKTRWGSCHTQKARIMINYRLLEIPIQYLRYVLIHEYAHFIEGNHSKAFHAVVASILPDWPAYKEGLKQYHLP